MTNEKIIRNEANGSMGLQIYKHVWWGFIVTSPFVDDYIVFL